ncbi:MAG: hypothetical protein EBZ06_08605, partial [Betaproteobacteria bacterium]|nr:hypothetical protein [Betaproteobacteria bacterium]
MLQALSAPAFVAQSLKAPFAKAPLALAAAASGGIVRSQGTVLSPPQASGLEVLAAKPSAFSTLEKPTSHRDVTTYNNFYEFG